MSALAFLLAYMIVGAALMGIAAIFDPATHSGEEVRRAFVIGAAVGVPWALMIFVAYAVVCCTAKPARWMQ